MYPPVKIFAKDHFPDAKDNLFACFIERGCMLAKDSGHNAMITMQNWMFLSSFERMRERLLRTKTILTMAHLGARAFSSISGDVVQTTAFVLKNRLLHGYAPVFLRLLDGNEGEKQEALSRGDRRFASNSQDEFQKIPGSPVAYWISDAAFQAFVGGTLADRGDTRRGLQTGDKDRFIRTWQECEVSKVERRYLSKSDAAESNATWFYFDNGGPFRKWYGNLDLVVEWRRDGALLKSFTGSIIPSESLYFRDAICWSGLSSDTIPFRSHPFGVIPGDLSPCYYTDDANELLLAYLNSPCPPYFIKVINPTMHTLSGDVARIPFKADVSDKEQVVDKANLLLLSHRADWDAYERSWDFQSLPLLTASSDPTSTLESSYTVWITQNRDTIAEMKRLEEENNRLFIDAYGLADELTPDVPIEQITLTVNPAYRYGGKLTEEELWTSFREDTMQELISYAIGCMMGRYSLDEPGLIYAQSGNKDFDPSRYTKFPADDDGIIPVTDIDWFDDDAANRVREFLLAVWGAETLEKNLTWLAEILGQKGSETPVETIRRYLSSSFFKDHLQTYKKRPIYWLFSSGKEKAFECLVYLHRYNESTLSRMRNEYVIPLQGKYSARVDYLANEIQQATSASAQKKLQKERDILKKKQTELAKFDEELRHYADQRISIDLDDGVKVNYGKFGKLLAEVKAVTGGAEDD